MFQHVELDFIRNGMSPEWFKSYIMCANRRVLFGLFSRQLQSMFAPFYPIWCVCVCVCYKTIDEPYIATDSRTHLNTRTLECSCKFSLPSANVHFVLAFFVCVCAHFRIVIAFLETNFGCSHREYTVNLIDFRRKEHITKFKQCQFYRCVFFCQPPSRWHSSEKIRVKDTEFLSLPLFF